MQSSQEEISGSGSHALRLHHLYLYEKRMKTDFCLDEKQALKIPSAAAYGVK